jgi:signal transduction histidine kinase
LNRRRRLDATRALQFGFLVLLVFSTAQVVWWILDQNRLAEQDHGRVEALYQVEVELAETLLAEGKSWPSIAARMPHLVLVDGRVMVQPEAIESLAAERRSRLRRYGWEGGFFLAVLIASMVVVARTLAEEAELRRRQENFLAAVSHEFKSPLASLQLSLETIQLRQPTAERLRELVERMTSDLDRLDNLVSELLDSASLESGERRLDKQPVGLAAVAREVAANLAARAATAKVAIEVRVDGGQVIDADPIAVRTVVANLLDNALRATAAAGGGSIEVRSESAGGQVRLAVADSGVGFPPHEAARLFEKFYRRGDELRRTGRGTGLGLYIVERLMQLERGSVRAESAGPGRGATFTVVWPAHAGGTGGTGGASGAGGRLG